jgi:hypothetical protein
MEHPRVVLAILAREPGPGGSWTGDAWRVALGIADADRWAPVLDGAWVLGMVSAVVLIAAALLTVLSRSSWKSTVTGLALVGTGLAVSGWSASSTAAWPDNAGGVAVSGWPGTGSSLVVLGALVAVAGTHGALLALEGRRFAIGRVVAAMLATVSVGASLSVVVFLAWPGAERGSAYAAESRLLPLAVPLDLEGPFRQRALVLNQREDGTISYSVLSHDGSSQVIGRADLGPDGAPLGATGATSVGIGSIAQSVADVTQSGEASLDGLTAWGIGTVVVTPGGDRIRSALDQNPAVTMVGGSERGTAYRIEEGATSRAWIDTGGARVAVRSTATEGSLADPPDDGGTLIVAVPASDGWTAWADGTELEAADDAFGRAAFVVPTGASEVTYAYRDPLQRWWWWASAIAVAWAIVGAVPLRRSREVAS